MKSTARYTKGKDILEVLPVVTVDLTEAINTRTLKTSETLTRTNSLSELHLIGSRVRDNFDIIQRQHDIHEIRGMRKEDTPQ